MRATLPPWAKRMSPPGRPWPDRTSQDSHLCHHSWYMDYCWYMSMKRTNVYADPEDLAIIKEAAARRGISEAEIIRQGIHLAAMANRVWDEPLFSRTFEGSGRTPSKEDVRNTVADAVRREGGSGATA
jgi:ribbon-helix-helix CopG family protein